jgi:hypothetical protein
VCITKKEEEEEEEERKIKKIFLGKTVMGKSLILSHSWVQVWINFFSFIRKVLAP